tara:strand:+ start:83 stop:574 length:492 start_codon:yes stop_codon:yes gene_type:complete
MFKKLFFTFFIITQFLNIINSELIACNRYPYESGLKVSKNKKKLIIKSTAEIKVFFNDTDEIQDSYLEAENVAITNIAKYLQTKVNLSQKKSQIKQLINKNNKKDKQNNTTRDIYDLKSEGYLSGIKILNKCYKKNDYVRVTVILDQRKLDEVNKLRSILNIN